MDLLYYYYIIIIIITTTTTTTVVVSVSMYANFFNPIVTSQKHVWELCAPYAHKNLKGC